MKASILPPLTSASDGSGFFLDGCALSKRSTCIYSTDMQGGY